MHCTWSCDPAEIQGGTQIYTLESTNRKVLSLVYTHIGLCQSNLSQYYFDIWTRKLHESKFGLVMNRNTKRILYKYY